MKVNSKSEGIFMRTGNILTALKSVWLTEFYITEITCHFQAEAKLSTYCHHIVWLWLSEVFTVNDSVVLCWDERCSVPGLSESLPNIVHCIQNGPNMLQTVTNGAVVLTVF